MVEEVDQLDETATDQDNEGSINIELREEHVEAEVTEEFPEVGAVARICALLFVVPKPLSEEAIQRAARVSHDQVGQALDQIKEMFVDDVHGFSLHQIGGGYEFRTAPGAAQTIRRYKPPKQRRISRASAETLAVIAYKQPVTKAEIEVIRGVDAMPTIKTLIDSKLIRIVGHENTAGQPALYGTTPDFLEIFGLSDLSELPSIRDITELAKEPGEVGDDVTESEELFQTQDGSTDSVESKGALAH